MFDNICLVVFPAYLVVYPIMLQPELEYLFAGLFMMSGLLSYICFVHLKKKLSCMGLKSLN